MKATMLIGFLLIALIAAGACDRPNTLGGPSTSAPPSVLGDVTGVTQGSLLEPVYYDGRELIAVLAAAASSDPSQLHVLCFNFGHDFNPTDQDQLADPVYIIFAPGAHQHSCPDGSVVHDHVVGVAPGDPGYTGFYRITPVFALENFNPGRMPITSVAAMQAAVDVGEMTITPPLFVIHSPILGPK